MGGNGFQSLLDTLHGAGINCIHAVLLNEWSEGSCLISSIFRETYVENSTECAMVSLIHFGMTQQQYSFVWLHMIGWIL
jgi:hypothetical protein